MFPIAIYSPLELAVQGVGLWAGLRLIWCGLQQRAPRIVLGCALVVALAYLGGSLVTQRLSVIDGQHASMLVMQKEGIENQLRLLEAQNQILQIQGQLISLQTQVIAVQSRVVDAVETELFLISLPQAERPRLPMPASLRNKLNPSDY